jgi:predicted amidohydrolase
LQKTLRVAIAQFQIEDYAEDTLAKIERAMEQAGKRGAAVVVTPESILNPGLRDKVRNEKLVFDEQYMLSILSRKAAECKVGILLGYVTQKDKDVINCAALIDAQGHVVDIYQKTHLFEEERLTRTPGDKFCNSVLNDIPIGILICFDLEFPEVPRSLALSGAKILFIPAANMYPYGHAHRALSIARAIENHTFVVYCNRTGPVGAVVDVGESCVIDPFGRIVAELGYPEGLLFADLDLSMLIQARQHFDYFRERRPSLYQKIVSD